jgi:hypothetical protein
MKRENTIRWVNRIWETYLPVRNPADMMANLKRNWYFPISAGAFFCISARLELGYFLAMVIALFAAGIVASQFPSFWAFTREKPGKIQLLSLLSALGVCWAGFAAFMNAWQISPQTKKLDAMLPIPMHIICILGAVVALFFVYFFLVLFWSKMVQLFASGEVFCRISKSEWILYGVLLGMSLLYSAVVFFSTDAFYGTPFEYDVIYTSDSPSIVAENAYLGLTHLQNDIRQPLFAIFSAPFLGIPYLIGRLTGGSATVSALLMNAVQIGMLFAANLLLTGVMELDRRKRICFMVLSCCTYTHLLFSLMMEQYIVAYFWLMFCLYQICSKPKPDRFLLWGAGGTLLTSMVFLPFMSEKHPLREFKGWFCDMVRYGLEFVAVMLIFCRFDVIFGIFSMVSELNTFAGHELTLLEKFWQYTAFVNGCFIAPAAGPGMSFVAEHISWQMSPIAGMHSTGALLLGIVLLSGFMNRKKKSSLFALGWIGFSLVMLVGLGWGTAENGLILYALYFGWAFAVLLFQLVEAIQQMLRVQWLLPAATAVVSTYLLLVNIPAIMELLNFATTYFPL